MLTLLDVLTGNGLIQFLVVALILCVVVYVLKLLIDFMGVPAPIKTILWLIIALVCILYLANRFLGVGF